MSFPRMRMSCQDVALLWGASAVAGGAHVGGPRSYRMKSYSDYDDKLWLKVTNTSYVYKF
jgi:hypothetical protein